MPPFFSPRGRFVDRFVRAKVPNVTADFDHLKMLGHVFVVEDAKDLAQIVRDVTRYGGAYRPEVRLSWGRGGRGDVLASSNDRVLTTGIDVGHLRVHPAPIGLEEDRKDGGQDDV